MKTINPLDPDINVDYRTHPGFSSLPPSSFSQNDDDNIYSLFREIDEVSELVTKNANLLSNKTVQGIAEKMLVPLFNEILNVSANKISDNCLIKAALPDILKQTLDALVQELHFKNGARESQKMIIDAPLTRKATEDLRKFGISMQLLPKEYIQALWTLTAPARQKCQEMRMQNPYKVCSNPLDLAGQYWEVTSQILKAVGFIDALSIYYGYQMVPAYCTLVHSYPGENWYRGCYEDVGLNTAKCTYMHYDHSDDIPKALIYLSEVGPENGPFSVVPGSNGWHKSHTQGLFFKFLDQVCSTIARKELGPEDTYHRPHFKSKSFRSEFAKLPRAFQGSSHFGDDVIDNSPLSNFLLSRELRITSDIGNCMLFSGHTTIHRGGIVEKGERWVFQLGFHKG